MPEPGPEDNISIKRKKLIFRSWHRGTREVVTTQADSAEKAAKKQLSAFSGMTAVTRSPLGIIRDDPDLLAMLQAAVLEGMELPDDVVRRQPGNVRRFRMTVARRQMTLRAGGPRARAAGRDDQVDISSELSGTIRSVEVDFNDEVHPGQVLARLDTSRLESLVSQSGAAVESATADVSRAEAAASQAQAQPASTGWRRPR